MSPSGGLETSPAAVTILGSGFTGATKVTFGGVGASGLSVLGPNEISATPPAVLVAHGVRAAADDGRVRGRERLQRHLPGPGPGCPTPMGPVPPARSCRRPEGTFALTNLGTLVLPPGCNCEQGAGPTEYDYVPAPHVTSISTSGGPADLASESGHDDGDRHGQRFRPTDDRLGQLRRPDAGQFAEHRLRLRVRDRAAGRRASPRRRPSTPQPVPFSVTTLGGQSNQVTALYAGSRRSPTSSTQSNSTTAERRLQRARHRQTRTSPTRRRRRPERPVVEMRRGWAGDSTGKSRVTY